MWIRGKSAGLVAALAASSTLLGGCGFSVYSLPLPGGASAGDDPITVKAEFSDVLDLVPQSTVKHDDADIGKITKVSLDHGVAVVTMNVRRDVDLPSNAIARIGQTSLLGEKYVDLESPSSGESSTPLESGTTIPLSRTGRNPEVEEVLGALSLILNGGGVAQLKTISTELNKALGGREDAARSVLNQVNTLMSNLDANKDKITNALRKITDLSREVHRQQGTIDAAMDELPSALDSIDRQRGHLKAMLRALDKLSVTGVRVIKASKTSTVRVIRDLQPTLRALAVSGDDFVDSVNTLMTFPFVDAAVGTSPETAANLHMGDYVNLDINLRLNLDQLKIPVDCSTLSSLLDDGLSNDQIKKLLDQTGVNATCDKAVDGLNDGLASLLDTLGLTNGSGRSTTSSSTLPTQQLTQQLGSALTGKQRAAMLESAHPDGTTDVKMGQLTDAGGYDKDLSSLLLPGLGASSQGGTP